MIMLYQCIIMLCVYTIYCYTAGCMHAMIVMVIYFSGIQSDCLTGEKKNNTSTDTVECKCMLFIQIDVSVKYVLQVMISQMSKLHA